MRRFNLTPREMVEIVDKIRSEFNLISETNLYEKIEKYLLVEEDALPKHAVCTKKET